ncbi:NifB/NifX family molybdenum-iron cluster-binding protein [Methylomarinum sp. Ch1-1]|uniref:NifB/NifX family molybdenum-iron cluster-binding protein n=1 Tax=Methylomarinum roseum TaxID=3067653 RepID=A0AAU7NRG6_9GAMM|nr:NifB/NifX family molybdenum-iron cluster-binding protein [Methylomarinum sp. Ch1-1]MDP4520425.1 NifB/NifX family molybdenum-iron cluster-binding protein [Methylomarinum sp. Ch1-1]
MKIAVASQNRRDITEHAGRCRKFWIYHIENDSIADKQLLELTKEQSFHDSFPHDPSPLDDVQVLIAGGMGSGLVRRLEDKNIEAVVTTETVPDRAVESYLNGSLVTRAIEPHEHGHRHAHERGD